MEPLPFSPFPVTHLSPLYWPDLTVEHRADVQPIWGNATQMLVEGGPWKRDAVRDLALRDPQGHIRNPGRTTVHEDEYWEPDPNVSSARTTACLLRAMYCAGWTWDQVRIAMWANPRTGGAFTIWDWARDTGWVTKTWADTPATTRKPYYLGLTTDIHITAKQWAQDHPQGPEVSPMALSGIEPLEKPPRVWTPKTGDLMALLDWMRDHPGVPQQAIKDSGVILPRRVESHLKWMSDNGWIAATAGQPGPRGGRPPKVWEIVPLTPTVPDIDIEELLSMGFDLAEV